MVGLILNAPRILSRQVLAVAIGTSVAGSNKHVPASLFDGWAETDEEAQEMAFRVNVERDKAVFAAKAKQGLAGVMG